MLNSKLQMCYFTVAKMKAKWKNIKDQKSEALEFLRNSFEKRETSGNIEHGDETGSPVSAFTISETNSPLSETVGDPVRKIQWTF